MYMRKILSTLCLMLVGAQFLQAQMMPTANLTIFSEDGFKFYLILNGERQNDVPQTNIRVEELPQPYYSCKIIFEDKTQKEISKSNLMLVDADGKYQDVTYKIKKDKSGKQVLRFHSFIPAVQNMVRPSNTTVYRFGNPSPIVVQQTTIQTQTIEPRDQGASIQINVGGAGVNMQVNDGVTSSGSVRTQTTTTTTTMTTNTNQNHYVQDGFVEDSPVFGCDGYAMAGNDFSAAKSVIAKESFDDTKLKTAIQVLTSNCLNTNQIVELCKLFSFEANKLSFAKSAYEHCIDPNNYFKVNTVFSFDSSKQDLNDYILEGRR